MEQKRLSDAERFVSKVNERPPTPLIASVVNGCFLMSKGQTQDAIAALEEAITRDPNDSWPRMVLVEMLIRTKEYSSAEEKLRDVLQVDPTHGLARTKLAQVQSLRTSCQ